MLVELEGFDELDPGDPEAVAAARDVVDRAQRLLPSELEREVAPLLDLMEQGVEAAEDGEDPGQVFEDFDEEQFSTVFAGGIAIESYLSETCGIERDVEEPIEVDDEVEVSEEAEAGIGGWAVGDLLGIPEAEVVTILDAALPDFAGGSQYSSGPDFTFEIVLDEADRDALAICTEISEALASHPDATEGTLALTIRSSTVTDDQSTEEIELGGGFDGEVLASNTVRPGDPGECR